MRADACRQRKSFVVLQKGACSKSCLFFFPCFFNVREFCGHKILFLFWCLYLAFLRVKVFGSHYTKLVILDVFVNPDALLLKVFFSFLSFNSTLSFYDFFSADPAACYVFLLLNIDFLVFSF